MACVRVVFGSVFDEAIVVLSSVGTFGEFNGSFDEDFDTVFDDVFDGVSGGVSGVV
jgi:hypothetical protein